MRHPRTILSCLTLAAAYAGLNAQTPTPPGSFTNEGPVGAANEQSYQIFTTIEGPVRMRIVRKGARYMMYAGKPGEYLNPNGPAEFTAFNGAYYAGIGVRSHDAARLGTAVFPNAKIEQGSNYR